MHIILLLLYINVYNSSTNIVIIHFYINFKFEICVKKKEIFKLQSTIHDQYLSKDIYFITTEERGNMMKIIALPTLIVVLLATLSNSYSFGNNFKKYREKS